MINNIKISVITPFYNTVKSFGDETALVRCLDALHNQKNQDVEFIFIDNNSEDSSREIIESYINKDSRFKLFTETKKGVSNARNLGLEKAKGEYITFIDSDDYIAEDYFCEAFKHINNSKPDILIGDFTVCMPDGTTSSTYRTKALKKYKNNIKKLFPFIECPHNIFFKQEIVQKHNLRQNPKIKIGEDNLFNAEVMQYCKNLQTLKSIGYFYQVYEGSSSNVKSDKFLDFIDAYDEILEIYYNKYKKVNKSFPKYILSKRTNFYPMIEKTSIFDEKLLELFDKYNIPNKYKKQINLLNDLSVVVQGPIDKIVTIKCLKSIKQYLPNAEIILSTWEGSDIDILDGLYDKVVLNKDPGFSFYSKDKNSKLNNVNRMIVSSKSGLDLVTTKYILKFRTDLYLTGNSFLKYFNKFNSYNNEHLRVAKKRILSCEKYSRNPYCKDNPYPMHPSDIIFFGLTSDVKKVYDIPLMNDEDANYFKHHKNTFNNNMLSRYLPEQHLWLNYLNYKKCNNAVDCNKENIKDSELSFANNLVILSKSQLNIKADKKDFFSSLPHGCYTHYNWLKMYKKYSDNNYYISTKDKIQYIITNIYDKRFLIKRFFYQIKKNDKKTVIKVLKIPVYIKKYK